MREVEITKQVDTLSPGRKPRDEARPPTMVRSLEGPPLAYFITWTTYGTWLPGDQRGSVINNSTPGTQFDAHTPGLVEASKARMVSPAFVMDAKRRAIVDSAIREHASFRGWRVLALHVRTNHVHVVIGARAKPEDVMGKLKSRGSRVLREAGERVGSGVWTVHGSTRYLDTPASVERAIAYVLYEQ